MEDTTKIIAIDSNNTLTTVDTIDDKIDRSETRTFKAIQSFNDILEKSEYSLNANLKESESNLVEKMNGIDNELTRITEINKSMTELITKNYALMESFSEHNKILFTNLDNRINTSLKWIYACITIVIFVIIILTLFMFSIHM